MSLKFTVVTAVFNAEDVIEKTIKSVLNQTYTPYEYLIIDGKSSDKTVEIIRKYSKHFEEKNITLKIVSEKDNGIYNAMNKGIDLAEGDFISFLNAGDWYELDALENINKFYEEDRFDYIDWEVDCMKSEFDNLKWLTSREATEYLRLPSVGALFTRCHPS